MFYPEHGQLLLHSWLRHYATGRKVAVSFLDEVIGFFSFGLIPPAALWPFGSSQPLTQYSTSILL
jgi:hypothetical protein